MSLNEQCKPVEQPEFQKLLESLTNEANIYGDLMNKVFYISNNLSRIPAQKEDTDSSIKEKSPEGVTEHLWKEIWKLRKSNEQLRIVNGHLEKVIGL